MNCIKCGFEDSLVLLTSVLCINNNCEFYDKNYSFEILTKGYEPLGDIYENQKLGSESKEPAEPDNSGIQAPTGPSGPVGPTSPTPPSNGALGLIGKGFMGSSGINSGNPLGSSASSGIFFDFPSFPSWDWLTDYDDDQDSWVTGCCACTNPYCNNSGLTFTITSTSPTINH